MAEPIRKSYDAVLKDLDEKKHEATVVMSSGEIDRTGEIILPTAFDRFLPAYLERNPIFLWGHRHRGEPDDALGTVIQAWRAEELLHARVRYEVDENEKADQVWRLVRKRVIRAVSIGAVPHERISRWDENPDLSGLPKYALDAFLRGDVWRIHTLVELVELSQVFVGACRDALVAAALDGLVSRDFAQELLQGLEPDGGRWEAAHKFFKAGALTRNDVRELVGLPITTEEAKTMDSIGKAQAPDPVQEAVRKALDESLPGLVRDLVVKELADKATPAPPPAPPPEPAPPEVSAKDLEAWIAEDPDAALKAIEALEKDLAAK